MFTVGRVGVYSIGYRTVAPDPGSC